MNKIIENIRGKLLPFTAGALIICALTFLGPVFSGISHLGMYIPALILLFPACLIIFRKQTAKALRTKLKFLIYLIFTIYLALVILLFSVFCIIAAAPYREDAEGTVIILGCHVDGFSPSMMLQDRLEAAIEYLSQHENAPAILSGGQGPGESISEAEAMRRYLTARGIDEGRLYIEDKSTNTKENLQFSAEIIRQNGLSENVVIVSDHFHMKRSGSEAKDNGLTPHSYSVRTVIFLAPSYWAREVMAEINYFISG